MSYVDLKFDELGIESNRAMNIWLYEKYHKYVNPDEADEAKITDAKVKIIGRCDDNPTRF